MSKQEIRNRLLAARESLLAEDKFLYDKKIHEMLYNTMAYQKCSNLLCYVSFKSEIDTEKIINRALTDGKKVYIPKVTGKSMQFYRIDSLNGLIASKFGVPEPGPDNDKLFSGNNADNKNMPDPAMANLMIMPGLAFDIHGNRIGYGAGYYDRYLQEHKEIIFFKIALAYDFQLLNSIEANEHDMAVDMIITPTKILTVKNQ